MPAMRAAVRGLVSGEAGVVWARGLSVVGDALDGMAIGGVAVGRMVVVVMGFSVSVFPSWCCRT